MIEPNKVSTRLKVLGGLSLLAGEQETATARSSRKLMPVGRTPKAVVTARVETSSGRHCGSTGPFAGGCAVQTNRLSTIEVMAASAQRISPTRAKILGLMLGAACPVAGGDRGVLASLWTEEAMHRAYHTIRLVMLLDLYTEPPPTRRGLELEYHLASRLADLWRSLDISHDQESLPCSELLREIACNLTELFGSTPLHEKAQIHVERLSLPAHKRRALVLAATNLLMQGLCCALTGRSSGPIEVTLELGSPSSARLGVAYDRDRSGGQLHPRGDAINGLADLLEGELTYRRKPGRHIGAEIEFPIPATSRRYELRVE